MLLTRRHALGSIPAALTALSGHWLAADAAPSRKKSKAKSVIMIFNCGAPAHIDLFDPKPDAPETVRSIFKPIATSNPDLRVTELMPNIAKQAHRLAVVRSVHHKQT